MLAYLVLLLAHGGLGLYLCWLGWLYADRLQESAGGRIRTFNRWSALHLREQRLSTVVAVLAIFIEGSAWLMYWILGAERVGMPG